MAFIFNLVSYLAAMVIGYCVGCNIMLQWIFNAYFLSVLVLTIVNKGLKIKASGHACSCTLPYLILTYYFSGYVTLICLLLYLAEFWASVEKAYSEGIFQRHDRCMCNICRDFLYAVINFNGIRYKFIIHILPPCKHSHDT